MQLVLIFGKHRSRISVLSAWKILHEPCPLSPPLVTPQMPSVHLLDTGLASVWMQALCAGPFWYVLCLLSHANPEVDVQ